MDEFTKSLKRMKALAPQAMQKQRWDFTVRLTSMMTEASRLGMPITCRALHDAVRATGWEQVGNLTKAASYVSNIV